MQTPVLKCFKKNRAETCLPISWQELSGPHQGLDSGYIEKSITQFRKPQRAKKAKHFVRKGRAGELKTLSKSREIIRGICKLKEQTAFSQTAWEYLHVVVTGL